jgi:uncharacterized membrane protein
MESRGGVIMNHSSKTEQLSILQTAAIISEEQQQKALEHLTTEQELHTPWFVHVLQGAGAWLSAVMFIVVFALTRVISSEAGFIIAGGGLLAMALIFSFKIADKSSYLSQLLFAASLTGHVLLAVGMGLMMKQIAFAALTMGVVSIICIRFYPYSVHKFLSVHLLLISLLILAEKMKIAELSMALLMVMTTFFTCWMWLNESRYVNSKFNAIFRPIQYALVSALLLGAIIIDHFHRAFSHQWDKASGFPLHEIIAIGFFAGFAWLIHRIFQRLDGDADRDKQPLLKGGLLALMLVLSIVFYYSPSILASLFLLLLGIERNSRIVIPLAIVSLIYAIGRYYYQLDLTLLHKSLLLMGSGLMLLVAGIITYRQGQKKQDQDHA